MNGKELKKLTRKELLEILLAQVTRIEKLECELDKKNKELASKKVNIKESGSIADASLRLSGIFEVADKACKDYEENIKENCKKLEKDTIKGCNKLRKKMLDETKEKCLKLEKKSEEKLASLQLEIDKLSEKLKPSKKTVQRKTRPRKGK